MRVLGIETSCDETGVAIYDGNQGLLAEALFSQIELHRVYGGVVPELASRDHIKRLSLLTQQVLSKAQCTLSDIDGFAYTAGPGLVGALLSGACYTQAMAFALNKPVIGVHHMEGHLLAPMLAATLPTFPFLALLVSGGHTLLIHAHQLGQYEVIGESVDDAVGECFDKIAKMFGLPYPGGPEIALMAEKGKPGRYRFPRPMTDRPGLDFSFSGLKTAVLTALQQAAEVNDQLKSDIAVAFEQAVVDTLLIKCTRALQQTGLTTLVVAGGVSANTKLRQALQDLLKQRKGQILFPPMQYCTDNGAMIAYAGYLRLMAGESNSHEISVRARWPLDQLRAV